MTPLPTPPAAPAIAHQGRRDVLRRQSLACPLQFRPSDLCRFGNAGRLRGRGLADARRRPAGLTSVVPMRKLPAAGYRRGHSLSRIGLRSNDHGCGAARRRRHAGGHHRANQRSSAAVAMRAVVRRQPLTEDNQTREDRAHACEDEGRSMGHSDHLGCRRRRVPWRNRGDTNTPIKIALNEWTGQNLTAHIAGKLLEKLGYKSNMSPRARCRSSPALRAALSHSRRRSGRAIWAMSIPRRRPKGNCRRSESSVSTAGTAGSTRPIPKPFAPGCPIGRP